MNKYISKLESVINKSYNKTENEEMERSSAFNRTFKCMIKALFPVSEGYEPSFEGRGWCECSGFVKKTVKGISGYAYISSGDYRWSDWQNDVLVRSAQSFKDYTGGTNGRTTLESLKEDVDKILNKEIQYKIMESTIK